MTNNKNRLLQLLYYLFHHLSIHQEAVGSIIIAWVGPMSPVGTVRRGSGWRMPVAGIGPTIWSFPSCTTRRRLTGFIIMRNIPCSTIMGTVRDGPWSHKNYLRKQAFSLKFLIPVQTLFPIFSYQYSQPHALDIHR